MLRLVFSLAHWRDRSGGGRATGLLRAFALAERLLDPWYRAYPVRTGGVLSYEIGHLPHGTRPLPLDPPVYAGDRIVRLHFNNRVLADLSGSTTSRRHAAWDITRRTEQDLRVLAGMAQAGAFPAGTRTVWAEALTYRAMARLGFEIREAKASTRTPFARLYILSLMAIYGPPGFIDRKLERLEHYQLGEAWMDIGELIQRYGQRAD